MKRTFIIVIFVISISFTAPATEVLVIKARHLIEYSQDNKKEASDDELLKQKVITYAKMEMLIIKVHLINHSYSPRLNSS